MTDNKSGEILIIEDDKDINDLLATALSKAGYRTRQAWSGTEGELLLKLDREAYALVLLDLMLPGLSGEDLLARIRQMDASLPVIILTAKDELDEKINLLVAGADDYITKPFQPPLLLAHIAAVLKRAKKADVPEKMICKGVELDVVRGCVKCQEQQVDLSKNELKILHYLFLHQGEIVPRIELVESLWDQQVFIDDNALSVNITRLRAKLAEIGVCDFIETKRGMGYRI